MENEGSTVLYKILEDNVHAGGSRHLCMLASVVFGMHETEHSKARHGTAGHDTARHRTALRRAVELPKLSGAGVLFFFLSASWV